MSEKTVPRYRATRRPGVECVYIDEDGDESRVVHRVRHSSTGFDFGDDGNRGAYDLALSLLWDFLDGEPTPELYQDFKKQVIAPADGDTFEITLDKLGAWLREKGGAS